MFLNGPKKKKLKIIESLTLVSNGIFSYVCECAINDFKEEIRNIEIWLNIYQFYYVLKSTQHNMNIFILDASSMLPYVGLDIDYDENLPCIVILYFSDHHFESIGIEKKKSKKIYRTLPYHDPFIQAIINYLEDQRDNLNQEFESQQNEIENNNLLKEENILQQDDNKSIKNKTNDNSSVDSSTTKYTNNTEEQSVKSEQHETLSNLIKNDNINLSEKTIFT